MHEPIKESLLPGKFCLLFLLIFAGFRMGPSAENLLFLLEGMVD